MQWFSTGVDFPLPETNGQLSFGVQDLGTATGISWVGARDATKHTAAQRTILHNEELSGPKYQ